MFTVIQHEAAMGRDRSGLFADRSFNKNLGIATGEGEIWEKSRVWMFKKLREYGFGKSMEMEHHIKDACEALFSQIDKDSKEHGVVETNHIFNAHIMTIMWQMMFGPLSSKDFADLTRISASSDDFVNSGVTGMGIINAFPFLRHICPRLLKYNVPMDFFNTCNDIAKKLFNEAKSRMKDLDVPTSLTESFVQNCKSDGDIIFNCENFQIMFQDLILGSTDTTSSYLESVVLYLILFPDIQEKIYQEILDVAPDNRFIEFSDRKKMIYTQAFLLESHRNGRTLPNFVPRRALYDFYYKKYIIKKDTMIMVDTRLYYEDKETWTDPEVFRPERFINENNEIFNASGIINFSVGKRNCPGELYANVTSFLFLTSLLQRYKISVPQGQPKPPMALSAGFALKPYPYQASFTRRV
ncbi:farnesoate epoxidase isoform X2 [Folsomia candida]|nr:farnesoate epoxidase isoform X2 [Folsomia candida]